MPQSSGACVRMPIWMERSGLTMPSRTARADEGAVRQLLAVVGPGVLVRVELHQRQRPVFLRMRLQQRPGDEMVAAEREEMHVGVEDRARLRLDRLGDGQRAVQVERHVAVVDGGEVVEDVDAERILRVAVEDRRGAADRLRAEAGARPVGHRHVERDAEDGEVDAGQVAAVAPPHEGERAGIGRVGRAALQRRASGRRGRSAACRLLRP